jgi:hypothetical protein
MSQFLERCKDFPLRNTDAIAVDGIRLKPSLHPTTRLICRYMSIFSRFTLHLYPEPETTGSPAHPCRDVANACLESLFSSNTDMSLSGGTGAVSCQCFEHLAVLAQFHFGTIPDILQSALNYEIRCESHICCLYRCMESGQCVQQLIEDRQSNCAPGTVLRTHLDRISIPEILPHITHSSIAHVGHYSCFLSASVVLSRIDMRWLPMLCSR